MKQIIIDAKTAGYGINVIPATFVLGKKWDAPLMVATLTELTHAAITLTARDISWANLSIASKYLDENQQNEAEAAAETLTEKHRLFFTYKKIKVGILKPDEAELKKLHEKLLGYVQPFSGDHFFSFNAILEILVDICDWDTARRQCANFKDAVEIEHPLSVNLPDTEASKPKRSNNSDQSVI